jgi:hypothetical protein
MKEGKSDIWPDRCSDWLVEQIHKQTKGNLCWNCHIYYQVFVKSYQIDFHNKRWGPGNVAVNKGIPQI